jgi:hypothetical protein
MRFAIMLMKLPAKTAMFLHWYRLRTSKLLCFEATKSSLSI